MDSKKVKGINDMDAVIERYSTVEKSLEVSLKELKLIRESKLPKLSIKDAFTIIKGGFNCD